MRDPIHPGETLREDLDALGMSAAELARRIEVPVNRITEILNGRRAITGDTALRLGRFFGTSGEFWLNLQKLYELRRAEQQNGAEIARLPLAGVRQPSAGFGVKADARRRMRLPSPSARRCQGHSRQAGALPTLEPAPLSHPEALPPAGRAGVT